MRRFRKRIRRTLGFRDADERQTKVRLAVTINDVLERRRAVAS